VIERTEQTVTDNERDVDANAGKKQSAGLVIAGIIVIAIAIFVAQNAEDVPVQFLFLNGEVPLWVIIIVSLVLGAILWQVALYMRRRQKRKKQNS
jgi:uncharacterized integral membrane protein